MHRYDDMSLIGAQTPGDGGAYHNAAHDRRERMMAAWASVLAALLGVLIALA